MAKDNIDYVVDAHVHIGNRQNYKRYLKEIKNTKINSAVIFPHSSDISQAGRGLINDDFSRKARERVNEYVLSLADNVNKTSKKIYFFPFNFIWPDFDREKLNRYDGVKWHRHDPAPKYNLDKGEAQPSIAFNKLFEHLNNDKMPIIIEDDFENVKTLIKIIDTVGPGEKINVIIPHLGFGTQSYEKLKNAVIWEKPNVYTDTSYASKVSLKAIQDYIKNYGYQKLLFGSDFPFAHPQEELEKILSLGLNDKGIKAITHNNILKLMDNVRNSKNQPTNNHS